MNYQCGKCFKIFSKIGECEACQKSHVTQEQENPEQYYRRPSMYEYRLAQVYATGNKWAIENWNATH